VTLCCFHRKPFDSPILPKTGLMANGAWMNLDARARTAMLLLGRKTAREKIATLIRNAWGCARDNSRHRLYHRRHQLKMGIRRARSALTRHADPVLTHSRPGLTLNSQPPGLDAYEEPSVSWPASLDRPPVPRDPQNLKGAALAAFRGVYALVPKRYFSTDLRLPLQTPQGCPNRLVVLIAMPPFNRDPTAKHVQVIS